MNLVLPPNLPVGVRFHPTDEELIDHYLKPKIFGLRFDDAIAEIDFCNWEPWELPDKSKIKSNDTMWWFMCPRDYKHPSSKRAKRTTKTGFWKITGKERTIKNQDKACIGKKRTLVFHSSPGKRTNWVVHEYYLDQQEMASYVICRLKRKTDDKVDTPDGDGGEPSGEIVSDFENPGQTNAIQSLPGQMEANDELDLLYDTGLITEEEMRNMLNEDTFGDEPQLVAYESDECSDEFVNGLIGDPDEMYHNETSSNLFRDSILPTSLKRSYFMEAPDGSDTDAEGANAQNFEILPSSSLFDSHQSSKKVRHMRMRNAPREISTLRTSATSEHFVHENVVPVSNTLSKEEASSSNFTKPVGRINMISVVPCAEFPKHVDIRGGGRHKRIQILETSPPAATSSNKGKEASKHVVSTADLPRKDRLIGDSPSDRKVVESSIVEKKHLESARCESSSSKWKTFFTFDETMPVSRCDSHPPSVYLFNAIIGTVLFVVFVRELVVFGSW